MNDLPLDALPVPVLVELVRTLQAQVAALEADLARLRGGGPPAKTSANSSAPPRNDWKARRSAPATDAATDPTADPPPPKRGPKAGHRGVSRSRAPADQVQVLACRPTTCDCCGVGLPATGGVVVGRRQVTELPPVVPVVVEAQRWRVRCRHCGHGTVGAYPPGFGATGAFGPRLLATVAVLHEEQHVAYERLVALLADLFGLTISEGALVAAVGRLGQALAPAAEAIAAEVRSAPVIGSDETSARVDGVNWWEWVFGTPTAAYHTIQRRRNTEVVLSFIGEGRPAVWVSDLWKPQLAAPAVRYQICLAHQLRDLTYAEQAETGAARAVARAWAVALAALLREAIHTRHRRDAGELDAVAYAAAVAGIEVACDALLAQPLGLGWSYDLQTRYQVHRRGLLTFLHDPEVPPTNNASERSLRPSVVHRKVTGGFRSEAFARGYAALRTVADTARKRGQSLFAQVLAAAGPPLPLATHAALVSP